MSLRLEIAPRAERDLEEIWHFIAQDQVPAADRFVDLLIGKFSLLASSPRMGKRRTDLAPELRGFPFRNYLIFYRASDEKLEIVRVLHAARDIPTIFS